MDFLLEQAKRIKSPNTKVVFPEGLDKRIITAASIIAKRKIASPILLGNEKEILHLASVENIDISGISLLNPVTSLKLADYITIFSEEKGFPLPAARVILQKPLGYAAMMVNNGDADAMIAGINSTTEDVVMTSKLVIGEDEGIKSPSSFMIMDIPGYRGEEGNVLMFADPGVIPDPTPDELADIAIASARSAKKLFGWEQRVALLSFSTHGSATHPHVTKVTDALELIRERDPDLEVDGELQVDAAIVPSVAKGKIKRPSTVAGRANILIFPDLDAGNIAFKLVQRLANAGAYGPFLQGFSKPVSDLSRGSTVEDIIGVTIMAVIEVQSRNL